MNHGRYSSLLVMLAVGGTLIAGIAASCLLASGSSQLQLEPAAAVVASSLGQGHIGPPSDAPYAALESANPPAGLRQLPASPVRAYLPHALQGPLAIPEIVGNWPSEWAERIATEGNCAYLVVGRGADNLQLRVLDVSEPANPQLRGILDGFAKCADDFVVRSGYAYVLTCPNYPGPSKIRVIDVRNPNRPSVVADLPATGQALAVRDGFAYTGRFPLEGLGVFDFRDPSQPKPVRNLDRGGVVWWSVTSLAVAGRYLFRTQTSDFHLSVFDLSEPAKPRLVAREGVISVSDAQQAVYVTLDHDHAYTVTEVGETDFGYRPGIRVFDIGRPDSPRAVGEIQGKASGVRDPCSIAAGGHRLYVSQWDYAADQPYQVLVYDVEPPSRIRAVGLKPVSGPCSPLAMGSGGRHIYVVDRGRGLRVWERTAAVPLDIGSHDLSGVVYAATVFDRTGYVATSAGVSIVDLSRAQQPTEIGRLRLADASRPTWLKATSSRLYMVNPQGILEGGLRANNLRVLDVSSPAQPRVLGDVPLSPVDRAHRYDRGRIDVVGDVAWTLDSAGTLAATNVANPTAPHRLSETVVGGQQTIMAIADDHAFVAGYIELHRQRYCQLTSYSISNPEAPARLADVSYCETLACPTHLAHDRGLLFGAAGGWLYIHDVSDPGNIKRASKLRPGSVPNELLVADGIAYVAGVAHLRLISARDPEHARQIGIRALPQGATLAALGRHAYLTSGLEGLVVIDPGF